MAATTKCLWPSGQHGRTQPQMPQNKPKEGKRRTYQMFWYQGLGEVEGPVGLYGVLAVFQPKLRESRDFGWWSGGSGGGD